MTISCQDIISAFLGKITSYDFLKISEADFNDLMIEYLKSAFAIPYIRSLFSDIKYDVDNDEIVFSLKYPTDEFSDKYFVTEIFAKALTVIWLEPQVKSQAVISQLVATSKEKYYSQQQHLAQLKSLYIDTQTEIRKMIRDYGYQNNSYLRKDET